MADTGGATVELDDAQARYVDDLVRSGRFAARGDVIAAGLQALRDDDADLEAWLRDEVVPVAEAMRADPSRAIPIDDVFGDIRHLHASRTTADVGDA